ncbi:enoyl-CoA hydratase [Rhodococcus sp. TAF43]|uniref:enoyl-CoA hydratase n=1 Tax=unclassified Rhodococcus (in: high G+C Gram-positive bacteria) TaxID=192944 RepID=UPI000E0C45E0|nr:MULTISPECIES: enoyl-CoA hydratase [unclassified Rhodococcus (in: high G+C Gram-positive bacteria)]QKT13383.1 enoyl-CoA hydratase [Rhodococcus sp. W8901]RDI14740.1 enoyl-CoA hydratase [Rhodococcus sp. AG1013]
MTTTEPGVVSTVEDGVLRVVIDRPASMNAVRTETLDAIADAFEKHSADPDVRVAVLAGSGRAFCTGADLAGLDLSAPPSPAVIDAANRVADTIRTFPQPVIGAVRGPAAGVGVSLALACDLTVASESSYFLLAFTRIGLMPDGGATALVAASVGRARAMALALLAERLGAAEALDAGLIAQVYADDEFDTEVEALAGRLAAGPAVAFRKTKAAINAATLGQLDTAFEREREGQLELLAAADFAEGVDAFQNKRAARFGR